MLAPIGAIIAYATTDKVYLCMSGRIEPSTTCVIDMLGREIELGVGEFGLR